MLKTNLDATINKNIFQDLLKKFLKCEITKLMIEINNKVKKPKSFNFLIIDIFHSYK